MTMSAMGNTSVKVYRRAKGMHPMERTTAKIANYKEWYEWEILRLNNYYGKESDHYRKPSPLKKYKYFSKYTFLFYCYTYVKFDV